ncbi:DUF6270 domain-containing protein [Phenylobacterium sp.]|uniref:DUF6270 domain-containing protein n=1 Tax=Phenylobacterium sp. TaxID=1871053 RepID=UPI0025EE3862|nr:DUF6270 domain-containing protein [Phenylobacterium sp.]MBX3482742.1 hypothetical protein [Phenylobacterium sp.]MCW5759520.1 hypothetical protein [Phenylobacterium sp.]
MSRIAIVGSCITRDLWPIRGGGAERLLYISRTSLPSLFSVPVKGFSPAKTPPGDLHNHEHGALVADLTKTALARLLAFRPTHVIFDFIDDRFDLVSIGDSLVLRSGEMMRSGYLTRREFRRHRVVPRLSGACDRLWRDSAAEFAALVRASTLSRAHLILHSARWATHHRDAEGAVRPIDGPEILGGDPADIWSYNDLLGRQEAHFEAMMPPMARIDAGELRLSDTDHRWGLSPFHYVPEYYDEVRRQLAALGLVDAFTGLPAEPSAPAA